MLKENLSYQPEVSYSMRRSIALQIKENKLFIKAPFFVSDRALQKLIEKKDKWISNKLNLQLARKELEQNFSSDLDKGKILFLGEIKKLNKIKSAEYQAGFFIENSELIFNQINPKIKINQKLFKLFVTEQAKKYLTKNFEQISKEIGFKANGLKFSFYKSKWGSCDRKGIISLNIYLILCRPELIHYVIIHELCHLEYFDHSKSFWNLVAKFEVNYKFLKKQMPDLGLISSAL
jgi:predicted metal-dependent hydrolase